MQEHTLHLAIDLSTEILVTICQVQKGRNPIGVFAIILQI